MEKLSIRDDFRSAKDESIADSKQDVPIAGEATHVASSQGPFEARTEDEKAKPANASSRLKNSIAGATEQPSVRDELRQANHESNAQSPLDLPLKGEPVLVPSAEPPYAGFNQDALGIVTESSSGAVEHGNAAPHQKSLPGGEKKQGGAAKETPFAVREKAVTFISAVAASVERLAESIERKESAIRPEIIRPVKLALKSLSIVLSCLVLVLLYMENKRATQRYLEQT
jgi:hypothetical protein